MPSNRAHGARSHHYGDPNYRNTSEGHQTPKDYKPYADRSAMLGPEMVSALADLHMSINEFARVTGVSGRTAGNYSRIDTPSRMPCWVDIVLRYAKIDPWFGRRFRPDGRHGYVTLRGSDRERWSAMMDAMEDLSASMVADDIDQTIKAAMRLHVRLWLLVKHLRDVEQRMLGVASEEHEDG